MLQKNLFKILAQLISLLLSPMFVLPGIIYYSLYKFTDKQQFWLFFLIINFLGILPILLIYFFLRKTGKISDWEISKREERHQLNAYALSVGLILIFFLRNWFSPQLFNVILLIFILFFIYALITLFWKISGHVLSITLAVCLLLGIFNFNWLITLLIPLVAWSRVYLKRHTLNQVGAGFLLTFLIFYLYINLLGNKF